MVLFPLDKEGCNPYDAGALPPEEGLKKGCPYPTEDGVHPKRGKYLWLVSIYYKDWATVKKYGKVDGDNGDIPVSGADLVVNGLAVNFAKLANLGEVKFDNLITDTGNANFAGKAMAYFKFFIFLVFHVALSIAVGLALLAFMVVLIVRMAVIWLCVAFMPFIFVGYAMGGSLGELNVGGEQSAPNIWKEFIKYAFLPVFVAVPFAIGFTLMSQLYYIPEVMPIKLNIENIGGFIDGIANMYELLWMIITIGIIWFGVFAVLASDKISGSIVSKIQGIGTMGAKIAGKSLGYAPIMPLPGGSLLGARDKMRGMATGYGPWRPSPNKNKAGDTSDNTPEYLSNKIETASFSTDQFGRLLSAINGINSGNAAGRLKAFSEELHTSSGGNISYAEAREISRSPEAMRKLAEKSGGTIDNSTADHARHTFGELNETLNDVDLPATNITVKMVAEKTKNALDVSDLDKVKKSLEAHMSSVITAQDEGHIQTVLDKINASDTDITSIKEMLDALLEE